MDKEKEDYIKELKETKRQCELLFDKRLFAIASGGLALSLSVLPYVTKNHGLCCCSKYILGISCVLYAITLLWNLCSQLYSVYYADKLLLKKESLENVVSINKWIRIFNIIAIIIVTLSIVGSIMFLLMNL